MQTVTHNLVTDIVEALTQAVAESATWQTHLDEHERDICLSWAAQRFTHAIKQTHTHALGQLRTVNELMGRSEIHRADVIKAILGEA
jgi:hypothetical protein